MIALARLATAILEGRVWVAVEQAHPTLPPYGYRLVVDKPREEAPA